MAQLEGCPRQLLATFLLLRSFLPSRGYAGGCLPIASAARPVRARLPDLFFPIVGGIILWPIFALWIIGPTLGSGFPGLDGSQQPPSIMAMHAARGHRHSMAVHRHQWRWHRRNGLRLRPLLASALSSALWPVLSCASCLDC